MASGGIEYAMTVPLWHEPVWWVLTIAMFLAWWALFARRYSHEFSLSERILAAFVSITSQILATTFILNWLHGLSWLPMGIFNAAIAIVVFIIAFRGKEKSLTGDLIDSVKTVWRLMNTSAALWIITVAGLLGAAWVIYLGQLLPPNCFDAWGYHYGWTAFARQEGHLGPFPYPNPHINFYPKNTEILFLWWFIV
ncbi:MAG TPA: hypothetical protein ENN67_01065, partial [Firmicutes bacterium]|nr:hypothetical protein [Bacillota bacterium]